MKMIKDQMCGQKKYNTFFATLLASSPHPERSRRAGGGVLLILRTSFGKTFYYTTATFPDECYNFITLICCR